MHRTLWPVFALISAPAFAEPISGVGYFTSCMSDSCEIVVDGVFAYVDGGYGTPTDVMIRLYELDKGVQALEFQGDMSLREDGFAQLVLSDFTSVSQDATAAFLQSLQGYWLWNDQQDGPEVEIDGLRWVESRPGSARQRWKVVPATACPGGETAAAPGGLVFTLSPWRSEADRPGCWEILSRTEAELTLRDLTDPQGAARVLRAAP